MSSPVLSIWIQNKPNSLLSWNQCSGRERDKTDEQILYMLVSYCHKSKLLCILWLRKINIYLSCTLVCGWTQMVVLQFEPSLGLAHGYRMVSLSWGSSCGQGVTFYLKMKGGGKWIFSWQDCNPLQCVQFSRSVMSDSAVC